MDELLLLVDEYDKPIGTINKQEAHIKGLLHRAISVFIFNSKGEIILQKRAASKYHSAGLWTNTCCSHPAPDETPLNAASRRLKEEMNIETSIKFICSFQYRSVFENGLIENEIDHVFYGISNEVPKPDPKEVGEWKYLDPKMLLVEIENNPELYTSWLKICIDRKIFNDIIIAIKNTNVAD